MADENQTAREKVASWIILCSGGGIAVISIVIIIGAYFQTSGGVATVEKVFSALVPLFGTWIGTVMAFYFGKDNYESAAKNTRELVGQLGDERLKQILVKDAWIPVASIDALTVEKGKEGDFKVVSDIKKKLTNKVTRVPVWDEGKAVRYVIHESMIYKFLADRHEDAAEKAAAAPAGEPVPDVGALTLRDFLDCSLDGVSMETIVSKIGWVAQGATLADAKAKMEGTPNCQDVFVTNTGAATEPVLGWITNADIAKKMKA